MKNPPILQGELARGFHHLMDFRSNRLSLCISCRTSANLTLSFASSAFWRSFLNPLIFCFMPALSIPTTS